MIERSGARWRRIFVVLLVVVAGMYFWYTRAEYRHGGSATGLVYGALGFFLILLLAFFGVRKRWYRLQLGTAEAWLQSHIYLGLLALVVVILHTGGRFHDAVAVTTLVLLAVVVLSGVGGAVLYAIVPRLLTDVESNLTAEQLSDQLNQMARTMARIASARSQPFQQIHDELIRKTQPRHFAGWRVLFPLRRLAPTDDAASALFAAVPRDEEDELRQLLVLSRQRKELLMKLRYQQRYRNLLEAWLWIHVPFTVALIVSAVVHIIAAFYYGRVR